LGTFRWRRPFRLGGTGVNCPYKTSSGIGLTALLTTTKAHADFVLLKNDLGRNYWQFQYPRKLNLL